MQDPNDTLLWTLLAAVILVCQARPNTQSHSQTGAGLRSECLGSLMRLSLDKALAVGNQLEVEAINGSRRVLLTPALAAQCGYSMESDPWGNTRIYSSLLGCYVHSSDASTFDVGLKLEMFSPTSPEVITHNVQQSCRHTRWAQREVLCDRNYMEVSIPLPAPDADTKGLKGSGDKNDLKMNMLPGSSVNGGVWKLTFYTPEPVTMMQREAEQAGYSARCTANRLVIRSPYYRPETYTEDVAGIPMEVLHVSVYYSSPAGLSVVDVSAACPVGGVLFSPDMISWHVPRLLTPLVDSSSRITELYLGLNGQRMDQSQLSARGYSLSTKDFHIVLDIPMGTPDGYFKSHAPEQQYHVTFSVEPMLEVLWRASSGEETRYKVLFPITTPLMARPPHATDQTVAETRLFSLMAGTFLQDVVLKNITFIPGTFTVEDCVKRGFTVLQQDHPNGTRSFTVQLGFNEDVVRRRNPEPLVTEYSLPLTLGFLILPERSTFSLPVELVASLHDVVQPTLSGSCDHEKFHVTVTYGNQGSSFETFETLVGRATPTPERTTEYDFRENTTHFSFSVPYTAQDTHFEMLTSDSVRARLDVLLWDSNNQWPVGDLYLICHFPLLTVQCFPNGSVLALALKLQSVPRLELHRLRLRDRSCKPVHTSDRSALFSFTVDSCGTSRKFKDNVMVYENEISVDDWAGMSYRGWASKGNQEASIDPEYRQRVTCAYRADRDVSVAFGHDLSPAPAAEVGTGQLDVHMRIATDWSFEAFYGVEDFPVSKFLQEPVFVEVVLSSSDPRLELVLQNCWATSGPDRSAEPQWDIIMDTCPNAEDRYLTELLPVVNPAHGTLPAHVKRFAIRMFTFTQEETILKDQIHIHCDTVICDSDDHTYAACRGQCPQSAGPKRPGADWSRAQDRKRSRSPLAQASSGPILLQSHDQSE